MGKKRKNEEEAATSVVIILLRCEFLTSISLQKLSRKIYQPRRKICSQTFTTRGRRKTNYMVLLTSQKTKTQLTLGRQSVARLSNDVAMIPHQTRVALASVGWMSDLFKCHHVAVPASCHSG
ncbi:hypothetical protein KIL84_020123 [Mauremys mutica]|uniref:Uncharacterized protein n=1 Tax=Mauremys mutica TaxID=74926 RepID=A0A9D3XTJ3_9SAUR|nr:hypothetical protein KIL84_020123 [Mauremys mutica]